MLCDSGCVCVCVCVHARTNSKGPGIPESCAKERVRRCSLSLSLSLSFPLPPGCAERRRRQSRGGTRSSQPALFFALLPFTLCPFPLFIVQLLPSFSSSCDRNSFFLLSLSLSFGLSLAHTRCSFFHCHSLRHSPEVESLPHM